MKNRYRKPFEWVPLRSGSSLICFSSPWQLFTCVATFSHISGFREFCNWQAYGWAFMFYFPTHISPMSDLKKPSKRYWICYRSKIPFSLEFQSCSSDDFLTFNFIFCASPCEESSAILRDFYPSKYLRACHESSELRSRVKFVDSMCALKKKRGANKQSTSHEPETGDVVALRNERSPDLKLEWINKTILRANQPHEMMILLCFRAFWIKNSDEEIEGLSQLVFIMQGLFRKLSRR